jgi:hypothetical protein
MSIEEFAELVRIMRDAQKDYFKTRSDASLHKSKSFEKQVDEQIKVILNPPKNQPIANLFSNLD